MSSAAVREILQKIDQLPEKDRLVLERQLAERVHADVDAQGVTGESAMQDAKAWAAELEAAANQIPAEEHDRFLTALAEVERQSKEAIRREWGLK